MPSLNIDRHAVQGLIIEDKETGQKRLDINPTNENRTKLTSATIDNPKGFRPVVKENLGFFEGIGNRIKLALASIFGVSFGAYVPVNVENKSDLGESRRVIYINLSSLVKNTSDGNHHLSVAQMAASPNAEEAARRINDYMSRFSTAASAAGESKHLTEGRISPSGGAYGTLAPSPGIPEEINKWGWDEKQIETRVTSFWELLKDDNKFVKEVTQGIVGARADSKIVMMEAIQTNAQIFSDLCLLRDGILVIDEKTLGSIQKYKGTASYDAARQALAKALGIRPEANFEEIRKALIAKTHAIESLPMDQRTVARDVLMYFQTIANIFCPGDHKWKEKKG